MNVWGTAVLPCLPLHPQHLQHMAGPGGWDLLPGTGREAALSFCFLRLLQYGGKLLVGRYHSDVLSPHGTESHREGVQPLASQDASCALLLGHGAAPQGCVLGGHPLAARCHS